MATSTIQCPKCGNCETIKRKKSFLGFQKCICTICQFKYDDDSVPLGNVYRIIYWVFGILCSVALLGKLPEIIVAAASGPRNFLMVLVQQWVIILFIVGSFWALRKDADIRNSNHTDSQ